jgi:hypothetical protein
VFLAGIPLSKKTCKLLTADVEYSRMRPFNECNSQLYLPPNGARHISIDWSSKSLLMYIGTSLINIQVIVYSMSRESLTLLNRQKHGNSAHIIG